MVANKYTIHSTGKHAFLKDAVHYKLNSRSTKCQYSASSSPDLYYLNVIYLEILTCVYASLCLWNQNETLTYVYAFLWNENVILIFCGYVFLYFCF